jgi:hypothetical protein
LNAFLKIVGFLRPHLTRFDRRRTIAPDSDKTHGNSVHWIVCRNTCGFSLPARASLNGGLMMNPEKA